MFQLTKTDFESLILQNAISKNQGMSRARHDNKGIQSDSLIFCEESKAVYNYIFILIMLKQLIPSFYAGCEKLWIFSNENRHLLS
jgi:hypothetical protein